MFKAKSKELTFPVDQEPGAGQGKSGRGAAGRTARRAASVVQGNEIEVAMAGCRDR
jgi:hypothetical protein